MGSSTCLSEEQQSALAQLVRVDGLREYYLAGGTAIAWHLGHRVSRDIDLFSCRPSGINLDDIRLELTRAIPKIEVVSATVVTLRLRLGEVPIDVVQYPYPPTRALEVGPCGMPLGSLLDLGTMKLSAVGSRGLQRDFWDLHTVLTRSSFTLSELLDAFVIRFGVEDSDVYHLLRALTYFDDAERDDAKPVGLTDHHWTTVREFFELAAPEELKQRSA